MAVDTTGPTSIIPTDGCSSIIMYAVVKKAMEAIAAAVGDHRPALLCAVRPFFFSGACVSNMIENMQKDHQRACIKQCCGMEIKFTPPAKHSYFGVFERMHTEREGREGERGANLSKYEYVKLPGVLSRL